MSDIPQSADTSFLPPRFSFRRGGVFMRKSCLYTAVQAIKERGNKVYPLQIKTQQRAILAMSASN